MAITKATDSGMVRFAWNFYYSIVKLNYDIVHVQINGFR